MTHLPIALFDIGGNEIVIILLIVLVLFGGEKMPELARGIGKGIREFKKAASGVEQELKRAMDEPPKKATGTEPKLDVPLTPAPPHAPFQTPSPELPPNHPVEGADASPKPVTPTTPEPPKTA